MDALLAVAEQTGKTPAQVAINWLLRRPGVTAPIIGARTMQQLESNLGASGWELDDQQIEQLDAASAPELVYPYNHIAGAQKRR